LLVIEFIQRFFAEVAAEQVALQLSLIRLLRMCLPESIRLAHCCKALQARVPTLQTEPNDFEELTSARFFTMSSTKCSLVCFPYRRVR